MSSGVPRRTRSGGGGALRTSTWAASARGQAGLEHLLAVFREELRVGMALTGARCVADVGPHLIDR